jgi:hypothetical protein
MNSFHICFFKHTGSTASATLTILWESVQLENQFMHCPVFYVVKIHKMEHIAGP